MFNKLKERLGLNPKKSQNTPVIENSTTKNNSVDIINNVLNDFLLINIDESKLSGLKLDINKLMKKINFSNPPIIIVCTQNSLSGTSGHFQHTFREKLKNDTTLNSKYKLFSKVDANYSIFHLFSKIFNVRTRIYYNISKVLIKTNPDEKKRKMYENSSFNPSNKTLNNIKLHKNFYKNSNKINITNNNIGNSRHDIIIYNYSVLRLTPDVSGREGKGGIKCTIYFKSKSQGIYFALDILNYSEGKIRNTTRPTKPIKEIFNKNLKNIFNGNDVLIRTNQNFKIVKIELSDNLYKCNKPYEINPMDLSIISNKERKNIKISTNTNTNTNSNSSISNNINIYRSKINIKFITLYDSVFKNTVIDEYKNYTIIFDDYFKISLELNKKITDEYTRIFLNTMRLRAILLKLIIYLKKEINSKKGIYFYKFISENKLNKAYNFVHNKLLSISTTEKNNNNKIKNNNINFYSNILNRTISYIEQPDIFKNELDNFVRELYKEIYEKDFPFIQNNSSSKKKSFLTTTLNAHLGKNRKREILLAKTFIKT